MGINSIYDKTLFAEEKRVDVLEEKISLLEEVLDLSNDGLVITDKEGKVVYCNHAVERITGLTKDNLLGFNIGILQKQGMMVMEPASSQARREKKLINSSQHYHSGKKSLITATPIMDNDNNVVAVVSNLRDISELTELNEKLERALKINSSYKKELLDLRMTTLPEIVAKSKKMGEILHTALHVAETDCTVLILGETGVGKEVIARTIHQASKRNKKGSFIKVNCGAIPYELLESELFGYEKGAFTGAGVNGKEGLFELADNGTFFLDEIGDLPLNLQVKILRVLQEGEIRRIGGTKTIKLNVRFLTATNKNLKNMIAKGEFREDLFYRLSVVPIDIPPIRNRIDDIPPLLAHYLDQFNKHYGKNVKISSKAFDLLIAYQWPGNVRELSNIIERLVITSHGGTIIREDLPEYFRESEEGSSSEYFEMLESVNLIKAVERFEKDYILNTVKKYRSTYKAAKVLGVSQSTVSRRLKKYLYNKEKVE